MIARERTLVATLLAGAAAAAALVALVALLGSEGDHEWDRALRVVEDPLSGFNNPRTVHFAPDGRLLVTDVGTGNDDGRVVAVDLDRKTQEVLMRDLPSASVTGQVVGGIAGPSAAAMSPDGTLCVVIGDGPNGRGFAEMRCSDGLRVDLKAYEREHNPGGGELESNPFDVVADGDGNWYVSDAAANAVLGVDRTGIVTTTAVLRSFCCLAGGDVEGVPMGLSIVFSGRGERLLAVALHGGAVATAREDPREPGLAVADVARAIAVRYDGKTAYVLQYGDQSGSQGPTGRIVDNTKRVLVDGLDRPTGFVRLPDGRFVVAEQERGRVRIVEEPK